MVFVGVGVFVKDWVAVLVRVGESVGVSVGVLVLVGDGVSVGVGVGGDAPMLKEKSLDLHMPVERSKAWRRYIPLARLGMTQKMGSSLTFQGPPVTQFPPAVPPAQKRSISGGVRTNLFEEERPTR